MRDDEFRERALRQAPAMARLLTYPRLDYKQAYFTQMQKYDKRPSSIKNLVGTQWTSTSNRTPHRHYTLVGLRKRDGVAHLRAALDGSEVTLPWRELRDRTRWRPDWQSAADEPDALHTRGGDDAAG